MWVRGEVWRAVTNLTQVDRSDTSYQLKDVLPHIERVVSVVSQQVRVLKGEAVDCCQ